jgi:hypothetical protein
MSSGPSDACQAFVDTVEMLLTRRRSEIGTRPRDTAHSMWGPRTWTRTELEDAVYASYKPMRQGRVTRPPRRDKVMEIADYLDCALDERNALLIAAECAPVEVYLTGAALETPLRIASDIARAMRLPAIVVNRDWRVHFINTGTFVLSGDDPRVIAQQLPPDINLMHLLFDTRLPLHRRLIRNRDTWTRMVRQTIFAFKKANVLSRFEPWYQALIDQLATLPEFAEQWAAVDIGLPRDEAAALNSPIVLEMFTDKSARPLYLRPLLISVGYFEFDYPQVIAFAPADEPSADIMRSLGIDGL